MFYTITPAGAVMALHTLDGTDVFFPDNRRASEQSRMVPIATSIMPKRSRINKAAEPLLKRQPLAAAALLSLIPLMLTKLGQHPRNPVTTKHEMSPTPTTCL